MLGHLEVDLWQGSSGPRARKGRQGHHSEQRLSSISSTIPSPSPISEMETLIFDRIQSRKKINQFYWIDFFFVTLFNVHTQYSDF